MMSFFKRTWPGDARPCCGDAISASAGLRCGRCGVFLWLGVALDAGGLFPGVDLVGVGFVFVVDGAEEAVGGQ